MQNKQIESYYLLYASHNMKCKQHTVHGVYWTVWFYKTYAAFDV